MFCLQPAIRTHLTIFNLNSDIHLSEKIFQSICCSREKLANIRENERLQKLDTRSCNKEDFKIMFRRNEIERKIEKTKLLRLAMKWNSIQIAKDFIFQNSLDNIMRQKKLFKEALKSNLPTFVYEFLKLKIKPADIFFSKDSQSQNKSKYATFIAELYHDQNNDKTHLKYFLEKDENNKAKNIDCVESLNIVLEKLIGDYMYRLYFETEQHEREYRDKQGLMEQFLKSEQIEHKYIMRDLFLWAILMNYIDMAKVFLSFMEYRICSALIATKILKEYHSTASYGELKDDYEVAAKYFEKYAIDCLDKCDDEDVDRACEIILQRNELYGYVTCLQVASDADDKLFIATPCCVQTMNNIWFDKLHPEQITYSDRLKWFLSIISLGLLAPVIVAYRENKMVRSNFFTQDNVSFLGKAKTYFGNHFKQMTVIAIILFYIGLILRYTQANSEDNFGAARIVMAIDLEIWWLRCMSFIIVIPYLGPHLVAIKKMIYDLLFFMYIIGIVMIAYGVASRSMVYYPKVNNFTRETGGPIDASFDGRNVFRQIIYPVYYLLYEEFHTQLDDLDNNSNAGWSIANHLLLAIHMIFVNILLTNLLIAMFSKRFDQVYEETHQIWHSQQYLFTRKYFARSPFIPPISFMYDIYCLSRMLFFFIRRNYFNKPKTSRTKVFKIIPKNERIVKEWYEFEDSFTSEYAHDQVKALKIASMKSKSKSDSGNDKKNQIMGKDDNDSNKPLTDLTRVKIDFGKFNSIIEKANKELEEKNNEFVRLDIETKLDTIENLLFKFWKIPKPTLIMSIIGGTKNFSLTDRLELKFLNSIINICIKSKVWMITNGFDTGIVQLVGRAIKKAQLKQSDKVIAIGICKWGSIKDVKALTKQNNDKTHLKYFLEKDENTNAKNIDSVETLNIVLEKLIGDYMHRLHFETEQHERQYRDKRGLMEQFLKSEQIAQKYIISDLFLWAILMNYIDMTKVFLSFMEYRICSALIATKIVKEYHSAASYGELKDDYKVAAKYFEKYAIDCLDKCDDEDAGRACEIILQQNELYGYVALDAVDKLFIATPCCVQAMNNI
ncbi:unnamed protein product [Rotaria sp. Silwood1]|nr:unnamed protein product [Rotaria sp. Silwood1]